MFEARYGLPAEVVFCQRCVMSNQRPTSTPEFTHAPTSRKTSMHIDAEGVCDACRVAERKELTDWKERESDLLKLLEKHRRNDGGYDCLVPGSGGKDSAYAAHVLKYKYGMHPLTCTWPPALYTDIGAQNFHTWTTIGGFDNVTFRPNGSVHRKLTSLAVKNLLHPFQTFILGQKNLAPRLAIQMGIPLVFYGENEAEYGNPLADTKSSLRDRSYYVHSKAPSMSIGGVTLHDLTCRHGLTMNDLQPYLPVDPQMLANGNELEVHYLGHYLRWTPQEAYYYACSHTGFRANPGRTEGTYSKYNSLDDKVDGFHYYTTFIKFGLGRASYDAAQEIRNGHITRDEGIALVRRFDGEYPIGHERECMDYFNMEPEDFHALCDGFRSPHLWKKDGDKWELRHRLAKEALEGR